MSLARISPNSDSSDSANSVFLETLLVKVS